MKTPIAFVLACLSIFGQSVGFPGPGTPASNGGTVANPTTSNSGGSCSGSDGAGWSCSGTTTVSLADATSGSTICYTTDGTTTPAATTPGTCSTGTTYSSGFSVSATTTVKAIGTKSGMTNSSVVTVVYTISTSNTITLSQQLDGTSPANNCSAIFSGALTCVLPGTPTNGHFIVLNITSSQTSCTISISQTGVTWAAISGATTTTTGGMGFVWLGQVGSSPSATATVTGTSCGNYAGQMMEFTCSPGPCAADGTPAVNSGTGTTYTSGSYTSSGTNELLFSALSLPGGGGSRCSIIVKPTAYTAGNCNTDAGAGGVDTVGSAYLLTNSAGSQSGINWSSVASLSYTNILLGIK